MRKDYLPLHAIPVCRSSTTGESEQKQVDANPPSRSTSFPHGYTKVYTFGKKGRCHTTEDDDATVHIMAHSPPLIAYHLSRTYDIGNRFPVLSNGIQKRKVDFLAKKIWEKSVNITLHNFDTRETRPAISGRFGATVWEE